MRFIVAVDDRWGIGKNGDLLLSIPEDMNYYRATTRGKAVLMGYNTLLSLPGGRPQPGRLNIVLADIPGLRVSGAVVCGSMEQLLRLAGCFEPDDVFVIGGGSIYRQLMPYCSAAHITRMRFDGEAQVFIPSLDEKPEWTIGSESDKADWDGIEYSFAVYRNSSPIPLPAYPALSPSMSAYFRKREPLTVRIYDDEAYMSELRALLRAYFRPLADGFGAEDVDRFFTDGGGASFEAYLRGLGLIAAPDDISALEEKYDPDGSRGYRYVTVGRDDFDTI